MAKLDSERLHRGNTSSELFICFTSRPSLSSNPSMKISSSKSLLHPSPGRSLDKSREPTLAFSSSLNRRLRPNGSVKGGQSSPMFPTGNKKRGSGFENAEPSSPKVTCIGQVRVKTKKKQGKRNLNGSFRKREGTQHTQGGVMQEDCLPQRNQKWVHLPLTICEALRAFGSEFNCFLPCGGRSTCSSRERGGVEKRRTSSCGAVFARWLMASQEGDEKRREIEIVVDGEEKIDMGIEERKMGEKEEIDDGFEEERVSICIPPKNALLLMRCRSEPLRMSALANRFWDSPIQQDEDDDDDDDDDDEASDDDDEVSVEEEERYEEIEEKVEEEQATEEISVKWVSNEEVENSQKDEISDDPSAEMSRKEDQEQIEQEAEQHEQALEIEEEEHMEESFESQEEAQQNPDTEEKFEMQEKALVQEENKEESRVSSSSDGEMCVLQSRIEEDEPEITEEEEIQVQAALQKMIQELLTKQKETELRAREEDELKIETGDESFEIETELQDQTDDDGDENESTEVESQGQQEEEEEGKQRAKLLPDCLLMMMCEPKLSMEVSKETWVNGTDFIRNRQVIQTNGADESKNRVSIDSQEVAIAVAAAPPSIATVIEQNLVKAVAYEPLVLTRCKSEPLRSSTKLVPEACFWKNRQIEPHRLGVGGAAGVGF